MITIIRAAIRLTPALIGKMQQHDRSSVSFTEHWHIQQQHTNASLLATANFALAAEFNVDYDELEEEAALLGSFLVLQLVVRGLMEHFHLLELHHLLRICMAYLNESFIINYYNKKKLFCLIQIAFCPQIN